jgi:hypothetical protein
MKTSKKVVFVAVVFACAVAVAHPMVEIVREKDGTHSVLLCGDSVIRLSEWGGLPSGARAEIVATRLQNFLEFGDPTSICLDFSGVDPVIKTNLGLLVTIDPDSSRLQGSADPYELAKLWSWRLVQVLQAKAGIEMDFERREADRPVITIFTAGDSDTAARYRPQTDKPSPGESFEGTASWYGPGFHGRPTASGEVFDQNAMTAAHKTLAFGTRLLVRDTVSGKTVIVVVNDRGPYIDGRILDLSATAARALDMAERGLSRVQARILSR